VGLTQLTWIGDHVATVDGVILEAVRFTQAMDTGPRPLYETPLPGGRLLTYGPAVAAWAHAHLRDDRGRPLDLLRWQRRTLNRALAVRPATGLLVHREYLVGVPRQSGKTTAARALISWALSVSPLWRRTVGLAYDRDGARRVYLPVKADCEDDPWLRERIRTTLHAGLSGPDGRSYQVGSRDAPRALRGEAIDLVLADELLTQRTTELWDAVIPATAARPSPLVFGISNAGDERAVLLRRLYLRGRGVVTGERPAAGYGMTWYGAREDADPESRRVVLAANPALREGLLTWDGVDAERESLTADAFARERLNILADRPRDAGWIGDGVLERQAAPDRAVSVTECRPLAMAVDASWGWSRATIRVAATMTEGVAVHVPIVGELVAPPGGSVTPAALLAEVLRLVEVWRPDVLAYDATAAVGPHMERVAATADVPTRGLGIRDMVNASTSLADALVAREVTHDGEPATILAGLAARRADVGESWRLSRKRSAGPIDSLVAMAVAHYAATRPVAPDAGPQVFV
jgi:hypothetical protein